MSEQPRRPEPATGRQSRALTPDELKDAVEELVDELVAQGVPARLTIYGGAALALVHYQRAATGDVDASFFPPEEVMAAAESVASRLGLRSDWLNDTATQFLPPTGEDAAEVLIHRSGVTVRVAAAELLLAMKLRASRPGRDGDDIAVLVRACDVRTVDDAEAIMAEIYLGEEEIPARGLALLQRALGDVEVRLATGTVRLPPVDPLT